MMHNDWSGGFWGMGFGMIFWLGLILAVGILIGYLLGRSR